MFRIGQNQVRRYWLPGLVFLFTAALTLAMWHVMDTAENERRELETGVTADQVQLRLEAWFDTRAAVLTQLAEDWSAAHRQDDADFTHRAHRIIELYPGFQALNFIDENWIIRIVVPEATNQAALGKDLHEHPSAGVREALAYALEKRVIHRSPLISLLQGEPGFATYIPVFGEDDALVGFINGVFGVDELVDSCLSEKNLRERFNFQLVTPDGRLAYDHRQGEPSSKYAGLAQRQVRIVDQTWTLQMTMAPSGLSFLSDRADEVMAVIGFALSLLIALLLVANQRRQEQLAIEREQFRFLVENQGDFLVKVDPQGKILYSNPTLNRFLGKAEEELRGEPFAAQIFPADVKLFQGVFAATSASADGQELEVRMVTPSGEFWTSWFGTAFRDHEGVVEGHIGVGRDISQRRELESQLRISQRLQAVGQLAGGIAHDFNNILQAIQGYIEFVRDDLPDDSPAREDLTQAHLAGERAAVLVRQLLAFSRRQILKPANLDLNAVIAGLLPMMERMIGPTIAISFQPTPELGPVKADQGQLEQILMNLAVNARDAMADGGTITIRLTREELDDEFCRQNQGQEGGVYLRLDFADTGAGMDEDVQDKLFEPFFSTKGPGSGTGLGLSTVYGIVKQHGGMIMVQSTPGEGSLFTIYLPEGHGKPDLQEGPMAAAALPGTERILLAKDEPLLRKLGQRILESAGYIVRTAEDGEEGWNLYREMGSEVDALVLDVVMPRLGGLDLADRIRQERPEIPVVFVSGFDSDLASGRREPLSGSLRLPKPYNANDLLQAIRKVLDGTPDKG
jgi:PAS domain S-box-containing protein|nr:ATP-binding protein [Candidatus Krumholzibacteria bacterium]